jgi:hypothetical protein
MRRTILVVTTLVLVLGATSQAKAAFVAYSNRSAFDAAVSNQTVIDFETPVGETYYGTTTGSTFGGATFTEPLGYLYVFTPASYDTPGTTQYLNINAVATAVTATFADPLTYAVGMDLGSLDNWGFVPNPGDIQITLSNGESFSTTVPSDINFTDTPLTFVGIVSDTPFTSLVITAPSQGLMIDNFAFSSSPAVATPAPSGLTLFASAILPGLGYFRWRRRQTTV